MMTLNGIIMLLFPHYQMEKQNQVKLKKSLLLFPFVCCSDEEITNLKVIKIIIHELFLNSVAELLHRKAIPFIYAGFVNIWSKDPEQSLYLWADIKNPYFKKAKYIKNGCKKDKTYVPMVIHEGNIQWWK